jgi:hypothetical protein
VRHNTLVLKRRGNFIRLTCTTSVTVVPLWGVPNVTTDFIQFCRLPAGKQTGCRAAWFPLIISTSKRMVKPPWEWQMKCRGLLGPHAQPGGRFWFLSNRTALLVLLIRAYEYSAGYLVPKSTGIGVAGKVLAVSKFLAQHCQQLWPQSLCS